MSINNKTQENIPTIDSNTQIIFTMKSFIGTISTILGIFFSFYFMVLVPKANNTEKYQKELYIQQQEYISNEFNAINESIKTNNTGIEDLNKRFKDLNKAVGEINNSGGSFSGNIITGQLAISETEIMLANNKIN